MALLQKAHTSAQRLDLPVSFTMQTLVCLTYTSNPKNYAPFFRNFRWVNAEGWMRSRAVFIIA